MAPTEKAPPDPTRRDPSDILAKLEQLIKDRQPKKGQSRSWLTAMVMALLAIAGMAIFSWVKMRHGRELARLRHEKNKQAILAKKSAVDQKVASLRDIARALRVEAEAAREDARRIEADIRHEEALYEANTDAIDRIRSWRDVPAWHDPGAGGGA